MNHIFQLIWILYFLFIIPGLCGIAWNKLLKRKVESFSYIFLYGYMVEFSVFFIYARICIFLNLSFTVMARGWFLVGTILAVVSLFMGFREIPGVVKKNLEFAKRCRKGTKAVVLFFAVVALFSILFVIPSPVDATPETLMITLATDAMYEQDPYTRDVNTGVMQEKAKAPVEMFYASICKYTGLTPAKFVHTVLPIPFFVFFFLVYWRIGKQLFQKKEKLQSQFLFWMILFYSVSIYTNRAGVFGVFQNIWMPETLLFSAVLPFVFMECVNFMNFLMKEEGEWRSIKMKRYIASFVVLFLGSSLLHYIGGFLVAFLLTCSIAIVLIRRIYKKCRPL